MMEYINSGYSGIPVGDSIFAVLNQSDDGLRVVDRHIFTQSYVKSVVLNDRYG